MVSLVSLFVVGAPLLLQEQPLLPNGTAAPNFTATDAAGHPVKLSSYRGKVVVIDFWASWCGPCNASMPHTNEVISKLSKSGVPVVALAVDDGEEQGGFSGWVATNHAKYSSLHFVFSSPRTGVSGRLYKVTGIPTQYVIDKTGKIRASFVGYGGPTNDLENAVRAANRK